MATTATTAGVHVSNPSVPRSTAATSNFTLSESTDPSTTTRTTPLEGQVTAEREAVIADVKETQAGQFNAVDSLSHKLENTQAATEALFTRDLPAEVDTQRQSALTDAGASTAVGVGGVSTSSTTNTIVLPATGQTATALPAGVTLVQTVTVTDSNTPVTLT